jgi:N-acetylneuraminic acid mutarotase
VNIYDITSGIWSRATLSDSRIGISAVTLNNKVYFSGGGIHNLNYSNKIDIYDNTTNSWSLEFLPEGKAFHAGIAIAGKIFWAGGLHNFTFSDPNTRVDIKDINTGTYSIDCLSFPATWNKNYGHHIVKDNKIVFLREFGPDLNKFDIYDVTTNSWSIGVLPQPLPSGSSFISVNNTIYIAGGYLSPEGYTNKVWKLEF